MGKEELISAFIALPVSEAIVGRVISGIRAFPVRKLKEKVRNLNGKSSSFRVAEIQVLSSHCECGEEHITIPQNREALIKECYSIEDFVKD